VSVLIVALVLLQNREPATDGSPASTFDTSGRETFLQIDRDSVRRITVSNPDGEFALLPEEAADTSARNTFAVLYEYNVAFDERQVSRIVQSATRLSSRRIFEDVDDPGSFGLAEPTATVTVETGDGSSEIVIGSRTPAQDAYYVQVSDDPRVFSVIRSFIEPFFATLDSLRVRAVPPINPETLQRVEIDTLEGRPIVVRRRLDTEVDPELGFSGLLTVEPYDRPYQTATNWVEATVFASFSEAQIGEFVDDGPENLSDYGLDPPRARFLLADDENRVEILIGDQAGGGRFAQFADEPSVFVVSGIGPIIRSEPYEAISPFALIVNIQIVDEFTVSTPDAQYVGRIERTEVAGEEEPEESFFLNGQPINEDDFRDLYQRVIGVQFDAEGDGGPQGTPVAEITFTFNDGTRPRSVSFYPVSENFLSVVRGGESQFIVARSKIERMISAFEEAAGEL
jgi:hypothetical protein